MKTEMDNIWIYLIASMTLITLVLTNEQFWEPTNITRKDERTGKTLTIHSQRFKKWKVGAMALDWLPTPTSADGISKTLCAHNCMDHPECISFITKDGFCRAFKTVPRATPRTSLQTEHWEMYEIMVCIENSSIS